MQAEIIVFSNASKPKTDMVGLKPFKCEIKKTVEEKKYSAVCLIEEEFIEELRRNSEQIEYKGVKHSKKPLKYYFRNREGKILLLNGCNYKSFSQLKRSINDFQENAILDKLPGIYFIAVSKEFFTEAKGETQRTFSISETKKKRFQNPMLNMVSYEDTKINLKERYIGNSEPCMLVRQMIAVAARHDFPVLVLGETGTGKEVVARNIHECSERSNQPFISINCGAIPTELFESELFGYMKGSHDRAVKDKKGLWELADKGTLFLDEIGDLSLNHQVKILKALEDGQILAVGGTKPVKVDARIIAATNKNIEIFATDKSEKFREDLYYRISTFVIRTPSLSSHTEDIPELATKIWNEFSRTKLSDQVLNQLRYINWPGNVRSLKHFMQRLFAFFGKETITEEHIQVLQHQEMENFLRSTQDANNKRKPVGDKDFERAIMKIEFLLKASLYCEDEQNRRELLEKVKESLEGIVE
jgi:transcriptional regulator with PAS, ATPase and Fis domain